MVNLAGTLAVLKGLPPPWGGECKGRDRAAQFRDLKMARVQKCYGNFGQSRLHLVTNGREKSTPPGKRVRMNRAPMGSRGGIISAWSTAITNLMVKYLGLPTKYAEKLEYARSTRQPFMFMLNFLLKCC